MQQEPDEEQELYEHHRFNVDGGQGLLRIDKYLMLKLANASRTKIQAVADAGNILVNDKPVKSSYKVKPHDVVQVVMPNPPRDTELISQNIPINIIYEDDEFLIVNKEAGMVVHPAYGNYDGTLVNALLYHLQNLPTAKGGEIRPGLVHRIDKDTSGLLVIGKTELAMAHLSKQFFDHSISRKYQALVWGDFEEDTGTIGGYINRSNHDRKVMTIFKDADKGKEAITHWRVLERFHYVTLIECELETGRTHQIRAHMQSIGHPLFGDPTYGGTRIVKGTTFARFSQFVENCFTLLPRQALHAKTLGITHPTTAERVEFDSELPIDFTTVLEKWRKYVKGNVANIALTE